MLPDWGGMLGVHRKNSAVIDDGNAVASLSYTDLKLRYKAKRILQLHEITSDPEKWKAFHEILRDNQCGYTNISVTESLTTNLQYAWKENRQRETQKLKSDRLSVSNASSTTSSSEDEIMSDDGVTGSDDVV